MPAAKAPIAFSLLIGAILCGCGGGGSGGLVGSQFNPQVRSIDLAADQVFAAACEYPLALLLQSAPKGSNLTSKRAPGQLTFNPVLELYESPPIAVANSLITRFYTDSSGTTQAGEMSVSNSSVWKWTNSYAKYPVEIDGAISVTGGNIPCSGSLTIVYKDALGANTATGSFTSGVNDLECTLNTSLNDAHAVGGSISYQAGSEQVSFSKTSGSIGSTIGANLVIEPNGWTGSSSYSVSAGLIGLNYLIGDTQTTAVSSALGGPLKIVFPDGSTQTIQSPITSTLSPSRSKRI